MFKKFLLKINPIEVIKALKKSDTNILIKGVTQMGGGGVLITSGVTLITDGAMEQSWYEIVSGCALIIAGVYIAKNLTDKIEKINDDATND
jgi:hypothetical protein